jgi:hypothetical protein
MDTLGFTIASFCSAVIIGLCVYMWSQDGNYQRGAKEREPAEDETTGPTTDDRLDLIFEALERLRVGQHDIRVDLATMDHEVGGISDDLEPLRRKLHEVAKQVDHIAGHFAFVPTAEILED